MSPQNLLIAGIYWVLVAILGFFSLFGVYILIRYGQSRPLALSIAAVYAFFFLKIFIESYNTLKTILA